MCNLEINIPCAAIEQFLETEHNFECEAKVIGAEFDQLSDILAVQLVVDDCDKDKFRNNGVNPLAEEFIENVI